METKSIHAVFSVSANFMGIGKIKAIAIAFPTSISFTDDFEIEIIRLVIGNKSFIESKTDHDFATYEYYNDSSLLGELIFRVLNNSGDEIFLDFQKGKIIVNSTEIELDIFEYPVTGNMMSNNFSDGENQYGSIWFGIEGLSLDKIILLRFMADAPKNGNSNSLGDSIDITIDLSEHKYEVIQDSLPQDFQDEFTE